MVLAGAGPAYAAALVTGLRKPKGQRHGLSDVGDRGRSPQADPVRDNDEQPLRRRPRPSGPFVFVSGSPLTYRALTDATSPRAASGRIT
jgi:hypothetical protein